MFSVSGNGRDRSYISDLIMTALQRSCQSRHGLLRSPSPGWKHLNTALTPSRRAWQELLSPWSSPRPSDQLDVDSSSFLAAGSSARAQSLSFEIERSPALPPLAFLSFAPVTRGIFGRARRIKSWLNKLKSRAQTNRSDRVSHARTHAAERHHCHSQPDVLRRGHGMPSRFNIAWTNPLP